MTTLISKKSIIIFLIIFILTMLYSFLSMTNTILTYAYTYTTYYPDSSRVQLILSKSISHKELGYKYQFLYYAQNENRIYLLSSINPITYNTSTDTITCSGGTNLKQSSWYTNVTTPISDTLLSTWNSDTAFNTHKSRLLANINITNMNDKQNNLLSSEYELNIWQPLQLHIDGMTVNGVKGTFQGYGIATLRIHNVTDNIVSYKTINITDIDYTIPVTYNKTYNLSMSTGTGLKMVFNQNLNYTITDMTKTIYLNPANTVKFTSKENGYIKFVNPQKEIIYSLQKDLPNELIYLLYSNDNEVDDFIIDLNDNTSYLMRIEKVQDGIGSVKIETNCDYEDIYTELPIVPDEQITETFGSYMPYATTTFDVYTINTFNNYMKFKNISLGNLQINLSATGNGNAFIYHQDFDTESNLITYLLNDFTYNHTLQNNFITVIPGQSIEFLQESGELSLKINDTYIQNTDYTIVKQQNLTWYDLVQSNQILQDEIIKRGGDLLALTKPSTDMESPIYSDSPYVDKSEIQTWFENTGSMSIAESLSNVKNLSTQAQTFLSLIGSFMGGMPSPVPEVFGMVIIAGIAIFFIRLIF